MSESIEIEYHNNHIIASIYSKRGADSIQSVIMYFMNPLPTIMHVITDVLPISTLNIPQSKQALLSLWKF
jgi:hypothetical protein